MKFYIWDSLF